MSIRSRSGSRSCPTLAVYLHEAGRTPLLDAEQEIELARRRDAGDEQAREQFIRANLRLVVSIATRWEGNGFDLLDLVAEGNIGLIRAVDKFDPDVGCRFSTFATFCIRQAIRAALRDRGRAVRIPAYMQDRLVQWDRAARCLRDETGREPRPSEVAAALGLGTNATQRLLSARAVRARSTCSLTPGDPGERDGPADRLADDDALDPAGAADAREHLSRLQRCLAQLDPRRAQVLYMRFGIGRGDPLTLRQVADRIGVTSERVRQLERQALDSLHRAMLDEQAERTADARRDRARS